MRKNTTNNNHVVSNEDTDENCVSVNVQHGFKTKIFDNQGITLFFCTSTTKRIWNILNRCDPNEDRK